MTRTIWTLAQRLRALRRFRGLTQDQLSELSGVKQSDISKIERGETQQTTAIVRLALALKCEPAWLELDQGESPLDDDRPSAEKPRASGVAQPVSHLSAETVPLRSREELMREDPTGTQEFRLVMWDDSMAKRILQGATVYFKPGLEPRAGDGVLIKDALGDVHVRYYRPGRPGVWEAHAENKEYLPLVSDRDGLMVLAVLTAVGGRWA